MKIQQTIAPVAPLISYKNIFSGLTGFFMAQSHLEKLKKEMQEYFGVKHVFFVSSGKAALFLVLNALKSLTNKSEVIIPAYTCYSVPSAVLKAGLKVSLCDINSSTLDFDYNQLKKDINDETLCIVPSHLFGIPSNLDNLVSACKGRGIYIVEDAAQAMGGRYKEQLLGTIGDVGFFSLGRGKNITCGSGGVIITNSDDIAGALNKQYCSLEVSSLLNNLSALLKMTMLSIFIRPSLYWFPAGLPFLKLGETIFHEDFPIKRLSGIEAGFLMNWKEDLEESNSIRSENAARFCEHLKLGDQGKDSIPYLRFPILLKSRTVRNRFYQLATIKGLGVSHMYPTPINEINEISCQFDGKQFPVAKKIADTLLTIPTHQFVTEKAKEEICKIITETDVNAIDCDIEALIGDASLSVFH